MAKLLASLLFGFVVGQECSKKLRECKSTEGEVTQYYGSLAETNSGLPCRAWTDVQYLQTDLTDAVAMSNYCRNPTLTGVSDITTPWCYIDWWAKNGTNLMQAISLNLPLYEDCEMDKVPNCDERSDATSKCLRDYKGTVSVTRCGKPCKCWSEVVLSDRPTDLGHDLGGSGDSNIGDNHNFCRTLSFNGTAESEPWCYIDDSADSKLKWDYCEPDDACEKAATDEVAECNWFSEEKKRFAVTP